MKQGCGRGEHQSLGTFSHSHVPERVFSQGLRLWPHVGVQDAPSSSGSRRLRLRSASAARPSLQVGCSEQHSHSSRSSQHVIFPGCRRQPRQGPQRKQKENRHSAEPVPGASCTELVNRKLQVNSAGTAWTWLVCFAAFWLVQIN